MGGDRLAAAALAAAVVAMRAPQEHGVLTFAGDVTIVKRLHEQRTATELIEHLLAVRGAGTTDLAEALRQAGDMLAGSRAARRAIVILSDCRHNGPGDPVEALRRIAGFVEQCFVVSPAGDTDDARQLASAVGGRHGALAGPADVPDVLNRMLA